MRLLVIIGSTRPGRAGLPIGTWFAELARQQCEVHVADLAEIDLPMLDEPAQPRLGKYQHRHTRAWSAVVEAADAVVIVTAEYNHGYPAPVKNAIDFLHHEWADKAIGFVSYGGAAGGTRAVEQLKQVVTTVRMTPVVEGVVIPFHPRQIHNGAFTADDVNARAATAMLQEIKRVDSALRAMRQQPAVQDDQARQVRGRPPL